MAIVFFVSVAGPIVLHHAHHPPLPSRQCNTIPLPPADKDHRTEIVPPGIEYAENLETVTLPYVLSPKLARVFREDPSLTRTKAMQKTLPILVHHPHLKAFPYSNPLSTIDRPQPTLMESTTCLDHIPFGHLRTTPIFSVSSGWVSADHIPRDKTPSTEMNETTEEKTPKGHTIIIKLSSTDPDYSPSYSHIDYTMTESSSDDGHDMDHQYEEKGEFQSIEIDERPDSSKNKNSNDNNAWLEYLPVAFELHKDELPRAACDYCLYLHPTPQSNVLDHIADGAPSYKNGKPR